MKPRIVALVPMRHNSERIPGKNYRSFGGRALYQHIIQSLLECKLIDEIVIDTDSPTIMEDCCETFPQIKLVERPEELRDGAIPMNDVLSHDISQVESDFYLQTHSTNPLLSSETISNAILKFLDNYPSYDSLFSVTRISTRLWDAQGKAINHNPDILLRTQDLPPIFEENSCLYIFSGDSLRKRNNRIGERPLMFEIEPEQACDIDNERDFRIAEFLYLEQMKVKG